jgi:hypothetical protein
MENGLEDVSCGLRWKGEVPVGTSVVWFVCPLIGRGPNSAICLPVTSIMILIWHDVHLFGDGGLVLIELIS